MGCYNCTQAIIEANESKKKVIQEAKRLANEAGEPYGIYTDEFGRDQPVKYSLREQYPNIYHVVNPQT